MILKKINITLLLSLFSLFLCAQRTNLLIFENFFLEQRYSIKKRLESLGYYPILNLQNISVDKEFVRIEISLTNKYNWYELKKHCKSLDFEALEEKVFNEVALILETDYSDNNLNIDEFIIIYINSIDIDITIYQDSNGMIRYREKLKMGEISDRVKIPLNLISKNFIDSLEIKPSSLQGIKQQLTYSISNYFISEDKKWYKWIRGKSKINIYGTNRPDSTLIVKILNVKGIISRDNLWELIRINISFTSVEDQIKISYTIRAKYSEGGFIAAKNENLYTTELIEDKDSLADFNEKFKDILFETLAKND